MLGTDQTDIIDTLRLDEKSVAELCEMLELRKSDAGSRDGATTVQLRSVIGIRCADMQVRRYHVYIREVGPDWCSVLIGLYTHPEQQCTIRLECSSGEPHLFEAAIESCEHVSGRFHEARLSIDSPVSLVEIIGHTNFERDAPDDANPNDTAAMKIIEARIAEAENLVGLAQMLARGETDGAWRAVLELVREVSQRHGFEDLRDASAEALGDAGREQGASAEAASRLETALRALRSD